MLRFGVGWPILTGFWADRCPFGGHFGEILVGLELDFGWMFGRKIGQNWTDFGWKIEWILVKIERNLNEKKLVGFR